MTFKGHFPFNTTWVGGLENISLFPQNNSKNINALTEFLLNIIRYRTATIFPAGQGYNETKIILEINGITGRLRRVFVDGNRYVQVTVSGSGGQQHTVKFNDKFGCKHLWLEKNRYQHIYITDGSNDGYSGITINITDLANKNKL